MEINLLKYLFLSMTFFIVIVGGLLNLAEPYLPTIVVQSFRYGKFAYDGKPSSIKSIEVPKRWFKHFYVFANIYSLYALYCAVDVYIYNNDPGYWTTSFLKVFSEPHKFKTDVSETSVLLALFLMTLQSYRRLYETWFISVFSDSKMNLSHYAVGFIHYFGTVTAIMSDAPKFNLKGLTASSSVGVLDVVGTILFFYAWFHQFTTCKILANLRKSTDGSVVTLQHKIPKGGLFKYVSSPHLLCEVLIYLALNLILIKNRTFFFVFLWVLSNQVETSLLTHWWYVEKFKNYPKNRKAIIPFVL